MRFLPALNRQDSSHPQLMDLATAVEIGIMAVISEVAEEIYRINVELPGKPVTVSMFVIDDELPDGL